LRGGGFAPRQLRRSTASPDAMVERKEKHECKKHSYSQKFCHFTAEIIKPPSVPENTIKLFNKENEI